MSGVVFIVFMCLYFYCQEEAPSLDINSRCFLSILSFPLLDALPFVMSEVRLLCSVTF